MDAVTDIVPDVFRRPHLDPGYYSNGLVPGEGGRPLNEQPGAAPEAPATVDLTKAQKADLLAEQGVQVDSRKLNHAQLDEALAEAGLTPSGEALAPAVTGDQSTAGE